MHDLKHLGWRKLGDKFITKFTTMLLDTEVLLDSLGQGDHLQHPREVAHLHDMLPKIEARKLAEMWNIYEGDKFKQMKLFMKD